MRADCVCVCGRDLVLLHAPHGAFLRCQGYNKHGRDGKRLCNENVKPRDAIIWYNAWLMNTD